MYFFLDEVSMVGSDMIGKMNFRLQEIMGNSDFMGGVSVLQTVSPCNLYRAEIIFVFFASS